MGISQGNLTYHYPTKQTLVEAIIDRLLERHTILLPELFYKNFDAKNTLVSDDALEHFMRWTSAARGCYHNGVYLETGN